MTKMLGLMTKVQILRTDTAAPDGEVIERAVSILHGGGLVVAPTETRYGLLARTDYPDILIRLFEVKQRPVNQPVSIFLPSPMAISVYAEMTPLARKLTRSLLPGPLTLVLEAKQPEQPPLVVNGKIGVRVSSAPLIQAIVKRLGIPVSATSANLSGKGGDDSVDAVIPALGDEITLCIDGGPLKGEPSTVVDASGTVPRILRAGSITEAQIMAVVAGEVE